MTHTFNELHDLIDAWEGALKTLSIDDVEILSNNTVMRWDSRAKCILFNEDNTTMKRFRECRLNTRIEHLYAIDRLAEEMRAQYDLVVSRAKSAIENSKKALNLSKN